MLEVIRNHNMKIDGEISILLTNMLILEQIAKDLDPKINILRCAVPYLHYKWYNFILRFSTFLRCFLIKKLSFYNTDFIKITKSKWKICERVNL